MLVSCPECGKQISDKAISCPNCGLPMNLSSATKTSLNKPNRRVKYRRLPNGFGTIKQLSGKRRKKYAVYPPVTKWKDNGTPIRDKAIGYYETYNDAYQALTGYNMKPFDTTAKAYTFAEVYEMFYAEKFNNAKRKYSQQLIASTKNGFDNLSAIHRMKISEIKASDVQQIINTSELKHASLELMVMIFKQVCQYALKNDIIDKDYSQFIKIESADDDEKGVPFTESELKILWNNRDDKVIQIALVMICTGMRISELKNVVYDPNTHCFTGGSKTRAGKGRIIPVSDACLPFIADVNNINVPNYRYAWTKKFKELGIETSHKGTSRTPHDCRHTFSWAWDKYVTPKDDLGKHLVMGHSLGKDVESSVYGHRTSEELLTSVNMMYKDIFI